MSFGSNPNLSKSATNNQTADSKTQSTEETGALPDDVAQFFTATKSLLNEEEEKIIKEYIQQNSWAIRDAHDKGGIMKLSKEAALIRDPDGKIRVIPPGSPKEEKMIPLRHAVLMYVDSTNDLEGIVLPKVRQGEEENPETSLLLGEGSFGKVKACHTIFKHKIAAHKTQLASHMTKGELDATKIVGGEYIAGGYRLSKKGKSKLVIITEVLNGELAAVAPGSPISDNKITDFKKLLSIALQVSDHLVNIHKQGFIHRDIQSRNIMFNRQGQARLIDYGLAINIRSSQNFKTPAGVDVYRHSIIYDAVGTPGFMAPEIQRLRQYSDRSDIYALAVVFSQDLCLSRFAPRELRDEINNFLKLMLDEQLDKRPNAEKVHLFFKDTLQKLALYELRKLDDVKSTEPPSDLKETMNNFINIIKAKNLGVEVKEENGNLQIIMSKQDLPLRRAIIDMLKKFGDEPDGTRLLSMDYSIEKQKIIVEREWIQEMSAVFSRHAKDITSTPPSGNIVKPPSASSAP